MRHIYSALFVVSLLANFASAQSARPSSSARHSPAKSTQPSLPTVPLPSEPGLYAVIYTSMGDMVCRLFEKEAPTAVNNFVGLAKGTKAWTDPSTGKLVHKPLYSGTTFHRVIPGFMIQGGDPAGNGTGSPGYEFKDEINPDRRFDRPGILAMANHGPNTNGSQFFITVAPAEHLNGHFTIFGEVVSGQDVADAISKVQTNAEDKPLTPVVIKAIAIHKVEAGAATSAASK